MQDQFADHAAFLDRRRAGILLHISSLPGPGACGDLGNEARHFVDFLAASGMTVWQTLPVVPTPTDPSPYQSSSVHAGNPAFISLEPLIEKGWLEAYPLVEKTRTEADKRFALRLSLEGFKKKASAHERQELERFITHHSYWIDNYAVFQALRSDFGCCWWEWPEPLRDRDPRALAEAGARLAAEVEYTQYEQFLFFRQWHELKEYAHSKGVLMFGDMPIFVAHDSAEVWADPKDFDLNEDGMPRVVAGVPPDYFSKTGQRWGNPLYRWNKMAEDGYVFWLDRMRTQLHLFDLIRIDHFRGFEACWEIPAEEEHAINGHWVAGQGDDLFQRLHEEFDPLPLVAEDLGVITPDVEALRHKFGLPGMKVLQFAFGGGSTNPYLPFNHSLDSVVYTGTHDNDTTLGWYKSLDDNSRAYVDEFLGRPKEVMPWPMIRCALASRALLTMIPMQDVLGLDSDHRMNLPGTTEGNWSWRFSWSQVNEDLAERLYSRVKMYGR